jgi:hypothetical protein
MLSLLGKQANVNFLSTEIESSVQHVERVLLGARFSVNTTSVAPKGDPPSWQSGAIVGEVAAGATAQSREQFAR